MGAVLSNSYIILLLNVPVRLNLNVVGCSVLSIARIVQAAAWRKHWDGLNCASLQGLKVMRSFAANQKMYPDESKPRWRLVLQSQVLKLQAALSRPWKFLITSLHVRASARARQVRFEVASRLWKLDAKQS